MVAQQSAREVAIEGCFVAFLPKPQILIDDQAPAEWRRLVHVYPTDATSQTLADLHARYRRA